MSVTRVGIGGSNSTRGKDAGTGVAGTFVLVLTGVSAKDAGGR